MRNFLPFLTLTNYALSMRLTGVKTLIQSDLTKVLILLILTALTAALLCPWLFNAGKMLSEVAESRTTASSGSWLVQSCANATIIDFFHLSLAVCTMVLVGPFIMWMRLGNTGGLPHRNPWSLKLPQPSITHTSGQPLRRNHSSWLHLGTGVLLAGSLTVLMMWLLVFTDWFVLQKPVMWWSAIQNSILPAGLSSMFQEWIFRGILLGICLRAMRPSIAIFMTACFFAIVHLLSPALGAELAEPEKWDAGFRMFALIGERFIQPTDFVFPFLTLFCIGIILAYARFRTASLWLPIGLHFGWLFIHRTFDQISTIAGDHLSSVNFFINAEHTTGLLPLSLLVATALLVHVFTQISEEKRPKKLTAPTVN